jgi:ribosomal protein S18 acetylase RimI-like enzyme
MTRLEPMDEPTYQAWLAATKVDYAAEKVKAGNWAAEDAERRSEEEFQRLLPEGRETPAHEIRSMIADTGEKVGYTWFTIEDRDVGRVVFIYDIAVDPEHRRQGHAQAALDEIAEYAREHGAIGVQLHVFGENTGARELYRKAGYVETNVMMLRRV